jgi:NADPH-dependent glutamate synthase beta subunit-like oxidoreductase
LYINLYFKISKS